MSDIKMPELKPLSNDAIPEAHEKAKHYRLLNAPWQAESICRDILNADPDNQAVIYTLILAITDQFESYGRTSPAFAEELTSKLNDPYEAEYCRGLIFERLAIATYRRQTPGCGYHAYSHFQRAMGHYQKAEQFQSGTNRESILRWNACVRFIQQHKLESQPEEIGGEPLLDD
ncbi:MAG: hypothetical protein WD097_05370 [Balneolales bacterium]